MLLQGKGIVEISHRGSRFISQRVPVDVNDLIELKVFADAFHFGLGFGGIHFGAADRNDEDGTDGCVDVINTRGVVAFGSKGGFEAGARASVGVIVSLEHKIDMVAIEDGFPSVAKGFVVSLFRGGKDGMVEDCDHPGLAVLRELLIEPNGLFFESFIAVERDHEGILVFEGVAGFFESSWTVVREGELRSPMVREASGVVLELGLFVISRDGHTRDHRIEPTTGAEPFTPFGIGFGFIDEIAGVDEELGFGRIAMGLSHNA